MKGNLVAQANLSLHAEGKYEKTYKKNIFNQAIPVCFTAP